MLKSILQNESGDDQLIVTLVIIAADIGLCIIFRNGIAEIVDDAFGFIKRALNALFTTQHGNVTL